MKLLIYSPEQEISFEEIKYLEIETSEGRLGILRDHAPIICSLVKGSMKLESKEGETKEVSIEKGFLNIPDNLKNHIIVVTSSFS